MHGQNVVILVIFFADSDWDYNLLLIKKFKIFCHRFWIFFYQYRSYLFYLWIYAKITIIQINSCYCLWKCLCQVRKVIMYLYVIVIDSASFCDFDIRFWNCSDKVVFWFFIWFKVALKFYTNNTNNFTSKTYFLTMWMQKIYKHFHNINILLLVSLYSTKINKCFC